MLRATTVVAGVLDLPQKKNRGQVSYTAKERRKTIVPGELARQTGIG